MHVTHDERTDDRVSATGTPDATAVPGGSNGTASDRRDRRARRATLVAALVATRVGDVVVTYHGLRAGLVEANPVAGTLVGAVGVVPALIGWSAVVLAGIVAVGAVGDRALSRVDTGRAHRRLAWTVWFGAPALVWLGACVYNLTLTVGAS